MKRIWELNLKVRPYIPFITRRNVAWRMIDKKCKNILDVGCEKGNSISFINRHKNFKVIGIDIFKPYLEEARKKRVAL